METKLTLRLRKNVIERAKVYARDHKTSLSQMIENYLRSITDSAKTQDDISPLVDSLSGVIELEQDYDYKKDYTDHLENKFQ
ncbi:MAG TPA: hypothetical protein ENN08_01880 [Bacteroidales bacterium]|nr:hypothetical protein [Bacteroidales bacterium]